MLFGDDTYQVIGLFHFELGNRLKSCNPSKIAFISMVSGTTVGNWDGISSVSQMVNAENAVLERNVFAPLHGRL